MSSSLSPKKTRLVEPTLRNNLNRIADKLRRDSDFVLVIAGRKGEGKTTLAAHCAYVVDPTITADRFCFNADQFIKAVKKSEKYQAIVFDEAGINLYSREAMSGMNRVLTKTFMVIRQMNLFLILCIPSFFVLDTYIRDHRVNCLIHIERRGRFRAWNATGAKLVSIYGKATKSYGVRTPIRGWFGKEWASPELHKAYMIKKRKHLKDYMKELGTDLSGYYTLSKFAEVTGYSTSALHSWIKKGSLIHKRVGHRFFIPKEEADKLAERE